MIGVDWFEAQHTVPAGAGVSLRRVTRAEWRAAAVDIARDGGRLLALWGDGATTAEVYAAFASGARVLVLELVAARDEEYPGLEDVYPAANRMQRAAAELYGVRSTDVDTRPWLTHGPAPQDYAFVRVEGDGVHEIPVGPVHAGIIEPGHFRFSVVGEKVLRLEQRLGYAHKGVERRFTELPIAAGHRLAARLCGDSAVAYSWAFAEALEAASGVEAPARAAWLRALCLELERIANHLGDLGALGNDAGFAFGLAQFSRLKEGLLRVIELAFGQRYLFDALVPGGMAADLAAASAAALGACVESIAAETRVLRDIYDEHAGLRGRFLGAGTILPALAARLGLTGLVGRASAQAFDLRVDRPGGAYRELGTRSCGSSAGDVAARVGVRFDELFESCRLVAAILGALPDGAHHIQVPAPPAGRLGIGLVEGWRGPVLVALVAAPGGRIRRCHPHDPSWQNWPGLEHAVIDNIVADFPLINKSFNLAYSGHDL
jgi:Ni,Fe-hydrogenase III large subunit